MMRHKKINRAKMDNAIDSHDSNIAQIRVEANKDTHYAQHDLLGLADRYALLHSSFQLTKVANFPQISILQGENYYFFSRLFIIVGFSWWNLGQNELYLHLILIYSETNCLQKAIQHYKYGEK